MAITKKAIIARKRNMAALIRKGIADYPHVNHTRGKWILFDNDQPIAACAVGYAMLGKWDGNINEDNEYFYREKIALMFGEETTADINDYTMALNDVKKLPLDKILERLESDSADLG